MYSNEYHWMIQKKCKSCRWNEQSIWIRFTWTLHVPWPGGFCVPLLWTWHARGERGHFAVTASPTSCAHPARKFQHGKTTMVLHRVSTDFNMFQSKNKNLVYFLNSSILVACNAMLYSGFLQPIDLRTCKSYQLSWFHIHDIRNWGILINLVETNAVIVHRPATKVQKPRAQSIIQTPGHGSWACESSPRAFYQQMIVANTMQKHFISVFQFLN